MTMQFINTNTTLPIKLQCKHNGEEVSLKMSPIISKPRVDTLSSPYQFEPLLLYIHKYKKEDELFRLYKDVYKYCTPIEAGNVRRNISNIANELLALINFKDLVEVVRPLVDQRLLEYLPDHVTDSIMKTGFGNRQQTYLREEYVELCAFITMLKVAVPPLIHHNSLLSKDKKGKRTYDIMKQIDPTSPIFELPAYKKIIGMITVLKDGEANDIQVPLIDDIVSDDIIFMIFANVYITKLFISSFQHDTVERNIVKVIFSKASKFQQNVPVSYVHIGTELRDQSAEDKASALEGVRVQSDKTFGDIVTYNWYFRDMNNIRLLFKRIGIVFNLELWNELELTVFPDGTIPTELAYEVVALIMYEFDIIHPGAIDYLDVQPRRNMYIFCTIFFLENGALESAMMVSSIYDEKNVGVNRSTLGNEYLSFLSDRYYGEVGKTVLNKVAFNVVNYKYMQLLSDKYILGNDRVISLPRDIKDRICDTIKIIEKGAK